MKDCVIVCGYPTNDDGTISYILKSRIDKAIELYQKKKVEFIIVSGGAVHNQYSEALTMKEYAIQNGIDERYILLENNAKSTYHNMMYSKQIMENNKLNNCYVVTNSWHRIKAKYYAEKFDLNFEMINADRPENMSYLKVVLLTFEMPMNMFIMRMKGYK